MAQSGWREASTVGDLMDLLAKMPRDLPIPGGIQALVKPQTMCTLPALVFMAPPPKSEAA